MKVAFTGHRPGWVENYLTVEFQRRGHETTRYSDPTRAYDTVMHLAAIVGRNKGELDPEVTAAVNAGLTARLARECERTNRRFVYVSSSEVYMPQNLYGLSKKWGEEAAQLYNPPGLTILRLSMPYGLGYDRSRVTEFTKQFLRGETVTVHDGARRSYCWVEDAARGIVDLLENTESGVYNVGRDDDHRTMLEVAELCRQATGGTGHINVVPIPPGYTPFKPLLCSELWGLGWRPTVELEEGVNRVANALSPKRLTA